MTGLREEVCRAPEECGLTDGEDGRCYVRLGSNSGKFRGVSKAWTKELVGVAVKLFRA